MVLVLFLIVEKKIVMYAWITLDFTFNLFTFFSLSVRIILKYVIIWRDIQISCCNMYHETENNRIFHFLSEKCIILVDTTAVLANSSNKVNNIVNRVRLHTIELE